MFLRDFLSNSQPIVQFINQFINQSTNQDEPKPISFEQAQQVAGGCSRPKGCTTLDEGVLTVTLRQPRITDFTDQQVGRPIPFNFRH